LSETSSARALKFRRLSGSLYGSPTFQDKAKVLGDLVDKGIILPKEARVQLGFPEEYPITTPEELQAILKRNGVKP